MATLQHIPGVTENIRVAPVAVIKKFHKLIFCEEGDRNNRKRLREFSGFDFVEHSEQYENKLKYVSDNFSVSDLTSIANILRIDYNKRKEDLIEDICKSLIDLNIMQEDSEVEDKEEEEHADELVSRISTPSVPQFSVNFRDVEDSIKQFDGSGSYPVEKWLEDMEDMSNLLGWSELHLFIFAKKSLTGLAKLFIQSERGIKSWNTLKKALQNEYSSRLNSAQLHKILSERKLNKNETVQEYFLIMKELASRGNIENEALIQYIIDGIQDAQSNKIVLYGAKSLNEFKEKLKIYTEIKARTPVHTSSQYHRNLQAKNDSRIENKHSMKSTVSNIRCFNCGIKGHKSDDCKSKNLGTKCFKCNKFGHKSYDCQNNKTEQPSTSNATSSVNKVASVVSSKMHKEIQINNVYIEALIDTGSSVNLMTLSTYQTINAPALQKSDILLTGFGKANTKPLGKLNCNIIVDNEHFETNVYVVPNDVMTVDIIIGNELLSQAELTIKPSGIKISKVMKEEDNDERDVMKIDAIDMEEIDIGQDLKAEVKEKIKNMIKTYNPKKIKTTNIKMKIIVKDEEPIYHSPRRLPFAERDIVDRQVEEWIQNSIVEPCSSDYSSQVVVTKKKCGSPRVCIDYRKINKKIMKDRYPLPLIEDLLDKLQDARIFTTIDLRNGFFHVGVEEESRRYTSFVTHQGQFQFLRVPFGLCNSPAVFQRFINYIFRDLTYRNIVLPYMDDLIIPASDEEEAVERLTLVLETARDFGLEINLKKCNFVKRSVEFLGHRIEGGKIFPSELKTKAVMKFPQPTSVNQVQRVINSTYQRSIKTTPFELMIGVKMKNDLDLKIKELLEEETQNKFEEDRKELREESKKQIKKVQEENKKTYNLRRRPPKKYKVNDLVAIKRTQLGPGLKLKPKYLGPYKVTNIKKNDTYDVEKESFHDGPSRTTTCAEYMKPWIPQDDHINTESSGSDDEQDGRTVGSGADRSCTEGPRVA